MERQLRELSGQSLGAHCWRIRGSHLSTYTKDPPCIRCAVCENPTLDEMRGCVSRDRVSVAKVIPCR